MYKVVKMFVDLQDGHTYEKGSKYPHDGRDISEKRLSELLTRNNKRGIPLIVEVKEKPKKKAVEAETE